VGDPTELALLRAAAQRGIHREDIERESPRVAVAPFDPDRKSDVVLADDNFASIVAGIREGRGVYQNIRKALIYLLVGNAGELVVMLGAALAGLPLPLLPLGLLWINLVTDGFPALALVMDPAGPELLRRLRGIRRSGSWAGPQWVEVIGLGVAEGLISLAFFAWAEPEQNLERARSLVLTSLVFLQLFRVFAARSDRLVFWEVGPLTNLGLIAVVAVTAGLQLLLLYVPALRALFGLGLLRPFEILFALAVALGFVSAIEISMLVRRGIDRHRRAGNASGSVRP
jgi:Ca2+-transporting ATPase